MVLIFTRRITLMGSQDDLKRLVDASHAKGSRHSDVVCITTWDLPETTSPAGPILRNAIQRLRSSGEPRQAVVTKCGVFFATTRLCGLGLPL
jgi:hypothetical protein